MIVGVSVGDGSMFVTIRGEGEPEFCRFEYAAGSVGETDNPEAINDDLRRTFDAAESVVMVIPAGGCFVKRIEFDDKLDIEKSDYRKWRAALELPLDMHDFDYGFLPLSKRFDNARSEMMFYATAKNLIIKPASLVFAGRPPESCLVMPQQLALVEVLKKSVSTDDISQAAIVAIENDKVVAVIVKDNRFYHSRNFQHSGSDEDETALDLTTYLLSEKTDDEELPLIVKGDASAMRLEWSPVLPAFLKAGDLDYASSWGATEFVLSGGRCELSAAN